MNQCTPSQLMNPSHGDQEGTEGSSVNCIFPSLLLNNFIDIVSDLHFLGKQEMNRHNFLLALFESPVHSLLKCFNSDNQAEFCCSVPPALHCTCNFRAETDCSSGPVCFHAGC